MVKNVCLLIVSSVATWRNISVFQKRKNPFVLLYLLLIGMCFFVASCANNAITKHVAYE